MLSHLLGYAILYQEANMSSCLSPDQKLAPPFSEQPCWQIEPLATRLNYSIPSTRRFLSTVGYHRSFSHNGKWYTLQSIPKFGHDGLWFSDDIGFSRAGNLNNTLVRLVNRSPEGITAEALGEKLRCRCHSVLVQLCRQERLQRDKIGRSFVYFSQNMRTAGKQRQSAANRTMPSELLPAEIAVLILAEFIRSPNLSFDELALHIKHTRHVSIKAAQIEKLFAQHGLKKTPETTARKQSRR
jgi:uncharacterized protein YifE (UPF0438 family)